MKPERIMGTVFKNVEGKEYLSSEFIEKENQTYFFLGITRGAIGCILSHLSVLQDAYDSGYKTIWIMEDDVEAVEDPLQFGPLIRELDQLADWDILYTDTDTKDFNGIHVSCRDISARPNLNLPTKGALLSRFRRINENFSAIAMRYGTYSMIVRRSGMKKILKFYNENGLFLPYDMDIWLVPDLKIFCVNRDIVSHKAGSHSDNGNPTY
ncbi:MAG: glycosyltransferase family 25 protein [Candidatus Melainabacteria bacterium]|nr:glycosyltransferase family 25 protein [Candidatus Melainabacteria bacterium]